MSSQKKKQSVGFNPAGLGIGVGIGLCFGTAMGNMGAGIAMGLGVGLCFCVALGHRAADNGKQDEQPGEEKV